MAQNQGGHAQMQHYAQVQYCEHAALRCYGRGARQRYDFQGERVLRRREY